MKLKIILAFVFFLQVSIVAENIQIDNLLEKVNQTKDKKEKLILIEQLKEKLAKKNRESKLQADAIIKAKKKKPIKLYSSEMLKK